MSTDQAKLDRIKASLASDAKAEGVSERPWDTRAYSFAVRARAMKAASLWPASTTAPAMAKLLLDEILWLEHEILHCIYIERRESFHNRLASIVNGWPEEML